MKTEFRLLWQINCSLRYESAGSTQGSWDDGAWKLGRAVCTTGRCAGQCTLYRCQGRLENESLRAHRAGSDWSHFY